jgi:hypothetical protein
MASNGKVWKETQYWIYLWNGGYERLKVQHMWKLMTSSGSSWNVKVKRLYIYLCVLRQGQGRRSNDGSSRRGVTRIAWWAQRFMMSIKSRHNWSWTWRSSSWAQSVETRDSKEWKTGYGRPSSIDAMQIHTYTYINIYIYIYAVAAASKNRFDVASSSCTHDACDIRSFRGLIVRTARWSVRRSESATSSRKSYVRSVYNRGGIEGKNPCIVHRRNQALTVLHHIYQGQRLSSRSSSSSRLTWWRWYTYRYIYIVDPTRSLYIVRSRPDISKHAKRHGLSSPIIGYGNHFSCENPSTSGRYDSMCVCVVERRHHIHIYIYIIWSMTRYRRAHTTYHRRVIASGIASCTFMKTWSDDRWVDNMYIYIYISGSIDHPHQKDVISIYVKHPQ